MNQNNLDACPGWQGHLQLTYGYSGGKTQAIEHRGTAPLKVQRSFYPESAAICHNTILHTAGGVVGGDRLNIDIDLQSRSRAVITTAAAGKIYGSNGALASEQIVQNVGENACLEWLPQETIIFDGALFDRHLRVNLAATASWLGWEIDRFGRTARGERFTHGVWKSATEVYRQGIPVWIDRQLLYGDDKIDLPNSLAGYPIVGTLAWIGAGNLESDELLVSKNIVVKARSLFDGAPSKIGVTRLTEGILCRYRGDSTTEVRRWFAAVWHLLRHSYLDSPPIHLRVWQ
ncbi:urease accessory protein UreD [Chamaesiphon polymorphus]|uniref:Urease accessory protein UreD n=1 Tax=Chamaesiphon polymorphus CCALA 037 TaxID=2107692 RepID=A0A2T1G623_9CYAN|nr:urease accessory protein UreD [Chamaesiphon polymorphus]PSB52692.1 urease accessory protein [Chamaesiphon polymorphus CCALA 037]